MNLRLKRRLEIKWLWEIWHESANNIIFSGGCDPFVAWLGSISLVWLYILYSYSYILAEKSRWETFCLVSERRDSLDARVLLTYFWCIIKVNLAWSVENVIFVARWLFVVGILIGWMLAIKKRPGTYFNGFFSLYWDLNNYNVTAERKSALHTCFAKTRITQLFFYVDIISFWYVSGITVDNTSMFHVTKMLWDFIPMLNEI